MKATILLLVLAICAVSMVQETDAYWWYGRGYFRNYNPYPYFRSYFPSYYYRSYNGWPYYRRSLETPRVECTYFEGKSLLACVGPRGTTECETLRIVDSSITTSYKFYGIGMKFEGDIKSEPLRVHYCLYPQTETKQYLNSTITESGKSLSFELYHHPEYTFNGFRVKESECFQNLTGLFEGIEKPETISVTLKPGQVEEIKILGGILLE